MRTGRRARGHTGRARRSRLSERVEVLYEDRDIIVIRKAAGIVSYPTGEYRDESAIQLIRRYWKSCGRADRHLYLLHRLDRETSGLMVFAKTTLARTSLREQFENHTVLRCYLAVTCGVPAKKQGTVNTMLGRNERGRRAVTVNGKTAVTKYWVLAEDRDGKRALVRCRLLTGRTHQVRIHLAYIGAPVAGDALYGDMRNRLLSGLALHACQLGFIHPRTRLPVVFRTPLPPDLRRLL
jgi:23S rRNA pseudouridine1911/1915/1917 synthase